ncbi:MAG TPA: glycosyltransferase, partial [Chloroflexota bacterium]|nr:glycosyltransferase [Chloroflexota bacterium]
MSVSVLNVSLDAQIAWDASRVALGDPQERQRRYAAHLTELHVVVKTGRDVTEEVVELARNAWAYPTRSATRYAFVADAYRIGASICRARRIGVVSAQDPFATGLVSWLLARRFGLPLNVQVHFDVLDNPYWAAERREHVALNALGKWVVRRADTLRVGTTREAERFAEWGIPRERIFVAPVPVDLDGFERAGGAPGRPHTVLNASRLVPQKDLALLLRAMHQVGERVPEARLEIAGDGPLRAELEELAAALGIAARVRFLGRVDRREMPALMASAGVLAVSSRYEGTSLVAVQAAAAGRPVVTTDVAGAGDTVIDGRTGRVVPIGDERALAAALVDVLSDPERARAMGDAGRGHVKQRYDRDQAVEAVVKMWERTARHDAGHWLYLANVRVPSEKAHVFQIFQMLDAFRDAGVDVALVYPKRANIESVEGADPARLYGLRQSPALRPVGVVDPVRLVTIDAPALNRGPLPALAFGVQSATFIAAAARVAARDRAQVIYSRDWPVLGGALFAGSPLVWEAHDLPEGDLARAALRRLLPRLTAVVAITRALSDELVGWGYPREKVLVAPDAVDLDRFADDPGRQAARERLGLRADERYVVYTGHLYAWKGVRTLALAARALPRDVSVAIVGGTPADEREFRDFVVREGLSQVRVQGHVPPAEVPVWLAAADVLALPNSGAEAISRRYTSPLKLFEYMAARRPIVASDLPSLREVLEHDRNAWLVVSDDPRALASGIEAVLRDPARAERLAAQARRDVEGRTWRA